MCTRVFLSTSTQYFPSQLFIGPYSCKQLTAWETYHTIIPGMAVKDRELYCPFGVMGGFMQPQGHLQVISNMVDFGMNPQEDGNPIETVRVLEKIGHRQPTIVRGWSRSNFGTGQIILRNPVTSVLCAGSDPRNDGHAIGW